MLEDELKSERDILCSNDHVEIMSALPHCLSEAFYLPVSSREPYFLSYLFNNQGWPKI